MDLGVATLAELVMFEGFWRGRRVLLTGHTGFKGSWLAHWLLREGALVAGYALPPVSTSSLYSELHLGDRVTETIGDVRDARALSGAVAGFSPELVLHLAAQPIVRASYVDPHATWETNVQGTINLLEAVRACPAVRACIIVTSDKCYENNEWHWAYREDDRLGGHDPYSASKAAAEIACASWRRSFFSAPDRCRVASVRAGNVIGGGDWSPDRIVPDFVRAITAGLPLRLRNPSAVRPWQHVIEPLAGYLRLSRRLLAEDGHDFAEAWNFGPQDHGVATVGRLAALLVARWGAGVIEDASQASASHEALLLRLDCGKAGARLGWQGLWDLGATVARTADWYHGHQRGAQAPALVDADLDAYVRAHADRIAGRSSPS